MHQEFNSAKKERKEIVLGAYLTILLEKVNDMFSAFSLKQSIHRSS